MTETLSPLDTMFLELEQQDEAAHMHIGAALVFDPAPDGRAPGVEDVRARVRERLPLLPRFAQRLSEPRTKPLSWLNWKAAADLDLDAHVRRARLPAPGGDAELLDWLGDFWSHRLDRSRPLWEIVLVEGLDGGRWALATKTHHCLVDGVGGLDIAALLIDGIETPAPLELGLDAGSAGRFWLTPGLVARTLGRVRHPVETAKQAAAITEMLVREEVIAAPHTSLNRPLGGTRHYATARFELAEVKEIKAAAGCTINDVVLALCAGALRHLLIARGEAPPERGLRAQIPVNVRSQDRAHALGNQITTLYAELPVAEPDPLARLQQVRDRMEALKHSSLAVGSQALVASGEAMFPALAAVLERLLYGDVRMFNLTITNVPGPQERLHAFGAPLADVLPLVPLFSGHTLGIAVFSYAGGLVFGLNGDRAGCPDLGAVVEGLHEAFEELRPSVHRSTARLPHGVLGHST